MSQQQATEAARPLVMLRARVEADLDVGGPVIVQAAQVCDRSGRVSGSQWGEPRHRREIRGASTREKREPAIAPGTDRHSE